MTCCILSLTGPLAKKMILCILNDATLVLVAASRSTTLSVEHLGTDTVMARGLADSWFITLMCCWMASSSLAYITVELLRGIPSNYTWDCEL